MVEGSDVSAAQNRNARTGFASPNLPGVTGRRKAMRRGGRVVEGARLESVFTGNRNAGSNPALSAISELAACSHRIDI